MSYDIDKYPARSGRVIGEDGKMHNLVDLMQGGTPASEKTYDVEKYPAKSGRVIGESGQVFNLVDLLQGIADGEGKIVDGAVTTAKLADKAVTTEKVSDELIDRIDQYKFTPLSGSGNDADLLTSEGVYFNSGGYGLRNAPRDNYGWMLIVSHGHSNNHSRGAQLYLDKDGLYWRGFDGGTFTPWETFIIKDKVVDVETIDDPATATVEDVANAFNALLAALKG